MLTSHSHLTLKVHASYHTMYHDRAALICDMIMQVHSPDTGQVCGAGLYPVLLTLWLLQPKQAQLHWWSTEAYAI